ncbi:hypothetical protein JCM19240_2673 [Vibrio maritimus]|uniref:Uncharacterized protein n=1 Tax=Vibrio maritimus TaxID=990268 RepID=A0A090TCX7_9VIBR|nr:hypothetical protein JCM19240_2673 [Vibrio maritimus]
MLENGWTAKQETLSRKLNTIAKDFYECARPWIGALCKQ